MALLGLCPEASMRGRISDAILRYKIPIQGISKREADTLLLQVLFTNGTFLRLRD
jgi:hypothetical protein